MEVEVPVTLVLAFVAGVYCWGWLGLRSDLPNVLPLWRLGAFLGGVLAVWAASASVLAALDHQMLLFHMIQHLLLMTVAAPLILLGAPAITFLQGLPRGVVRNLLGPLSRKRLVRKGAGLITHPAFCWIASTATVMAWHIPALFRIGMQSPAWHLTEQATFLVAGLLFWWPVVRPWPSVAAGTPWSVPVYLFLATLPCDALSAFLTFCNRVVYPHYLSAPRLLNLSALEDQESAGALMWVWVTFVYLAPAAAITVRMLSPRARSYKPQSSRAS